MINEFHRHQPGKKNMNIHRLPNARGSLPRLSYILLCTLLAGVFALCGCQKTPEESESSDSSSQETSVDSSTEAFISNYVYVPSTLKVHELNDYTYLLPDGEMTEEDGNTYVFERTVPLEAREAFIQDQELLLSQLTFSEPDIEEKTYTIFLSASYMDRSDMENNTAFFLTTSAHSWQQVLTTLQFLEGDDIRYGYAWAKANAIAKGLGWQTDPIQTPSEETIQEFASADPGRMSLVYPCYIEPYSTAQQIEIAKYLALDIYQSLASDTTLASPISEEAFITAIQDYTKEHDLPYTETDLRFSNGGRSVPMIIRTKYVEEWIAKDFQTDSAYMNTDVEIPDFLNWQKNITELIRLRSLTDQVIAMSREALGFEDPALKQVLCYQYKATDQYGGYTSFNNDSIVVSSAYVIAHEYVHYIHSHLLTTHRPTFAWCIEALAVHYSWQMELELVNLLRRAAGYEPQSIEAYTAESISFVLDRMRSFEKSPTDILNQGQHGTGYYGSYFLIGHYLVELYGEDVFTQLMLYPENAEALTGKSIDEIIADWDQYVTEAMETP